MKTPDLEFITIGRILAPWGVKGKLKVKVETDFPQRFVSGAEIYLDHEPQVIESAEWHSGKLIIKLRSVDSIEDAQKLRGKLIEIPFSQLQPLPEGHYYYFQLIGLEVWTTGGELLGKISEILTTGSNDIYVVSNARGEILIPAIEDVVKSVDLDKQNMVIEPIDGLLNLNQRAGL
ncbi:MAG TPA: 16S rRNA processing protein RimM [Dehalococcoidia bacterium]|jgi:16S rRNA processing protein RimM|nr:16S rRNA processing protein RimM [Dehalococcoidia bacterium]